MEQKHQKRLKKVSPDGFSSGNPPALQLFCEFAPFVELLPVGEIPK